MSDSAAGDERPPHPRTRFGPQRQALFLEALAETSNVARSARAAGIGLATVWRCRRDQPGFARAWDDALDQGLADLHARLIERARFGTVEEQTTSKEGETQRRTTRKADDALARWLLARRAEDRATLAAAREAAVSADYDEAALRQRVVAAIAALRTGELSEAELADAAALDAAVDERKAEIERSCIAQTLDGLNASERAVVDAALSVRDRAELERAWSIVARPEQRPPAGDWSCWLLMAGRGFGKTRSGAEWIDAAARATPRLQIALVGATLDDARRVMIEGESGVLSCARGRTAPVWAPSLKALTWANGSIARVYSAADPESLRGPAHHIAWVDELARWEAGGGREGGSLDPRSAGQAALDNLIMGLRLGERPRLVATTTPRPVPILKQLLARAGTVVTRGSTADNAANLPAAFIADMRATYGDTLLARQELLGELIEDAPDALWPRAAIEATRVAAVGPADAARFERIVIGVDPPASDRGDACGIVVCGMLRGDAAEGAGEGPRYLVLEDASVERASPTRWANAVAAAAARWGADCVVAEANNGGAMVGSVLAAADAALPLRLVHASRGKHARAEPIALKWANGEAGCAAVHARLEDEMSGFCGHGGWIGPGRSPDRADAMVWAMTALIGGARTAPRVRRL